MANFVIIPSPKQLNEHNPCGHWHRRTDIEGIIVGTPLPTNCWNLAVGISGNKIALIANGIHFPHEIIFFAYDISTRIWLTLEPRIENFFTSQWQTGVDTNGPDVVWAGYGADSSGSRFSPTVTNYRARLIITRVAGGSIFDHSFTPARATNYEGKVAVSANRNNVVVLVETDTQLTTYVSHNAGQIFYPGQIFAYTGNYVTSRIVKSADGYFYLAILYRTGEVIRIYRSPFGDSWTLQSTLSVSGGLTRFNMNWDGGVLHILAGIGFHYSTDSGITFTTRAVATNSFYFGADGAAERKDLAILTTAGNKLCVDYTVNPLVFEDTGFIPQIQFVDGAYSTVRNSGQYLVYTKDNPSSTTHHVAIAVSTDLTRNWDIVDSPLKWFVGQEEAIFGDDDPRWKFSRQPNKVALDPQYK